MIHQQDFAIVIPLANEEKEFAPLIKSITRILDLYNSGQVYFVVDTVSKDRTFELCKELQEKDSRFYTIWAPENRNVVDAYLKGLEHAHSQAHEIIIEMDAGLSHDPRAIPMFLRVLNEGNECAFGSRFTNGGSMADSPFKRRFFSKFGTILTNLLLGSKMYDMTSGFHGYHNNVVGEILSYTFLSKAHFYQAEMRYLLRKKRFAEIPIHYRAPSDRVPKGAIRNAFNVLFYYFFKRLRFSAIYI